MSVITNPDWLKKPTSEQITAAWPTAALLKGKSGRAELDCRVNVQGLVEDCKAIEEDPVGLGFGDAALSLTPQLQFRPATRDGSPFPSRVHVPISFKAQGAVPAETLLSIKLLTRPIWAAAPTFAQLGAAYPKGGGGAAGYVAFRCHVKGDGGLKYCEAIDENPKSRGFANAARGLLASFEIDMSSLLWKTSDKLQVDVPIRLVDPASDEFREHRIGEPIWIALVDPTRSTNLFPAEAFKAGLRSGRGRAHCVVTADGTLTACTPAAADPPGLGFSEMAVHVVGAMRMNRWTNGGGPIDGATVTIPVRLENGAAVGVKPQPPSS